MGLGLGLENKERTKEDQGTTKALMAILDILENWKEGGSSPVHVIIL